MLAAINTVPPVTEYLAEHVLVVETPNDEPVMVALVHDGSIVWSNAARHEDWTKAASRRDRRFVVSEFIVHAIVIGSLCVGGLAVTIKRLFRP